VIFSVSISLSAPAQTPTISDFDRQRAQLMLKVVGDEVRKHYYDPKFHGVDLDKEFGDAKQRIEKVNTMNMALSNIANFLDSLDDSHTFFLPPSHPIRLDYGWQYQMFGDRCFVTQVRANSDAATKGVKPGDQVLAINGIAPTRETVWKLQYMYTALRPQPSLRLALQDPTGKQRQVEVAAHIVETKRVTNLTDGGDIWNVIREMEAYDHYSRTRFAEFGEDLIVVRLAEFEYTPREVAELMGKVRKHKALILDLRGNPGGATETVEFLAGDLLSKDVKIADRAGRKETKPMMTKGSHDAFTGKLIVLVDSQSASAAEVLTRLMQIEKRGVVLGDRSSGSVMEARHYSEKIGADTAVFYGVSITDADLIMSDGKSLEHVGVTPDEMILPTASDLASHLDPVMARAAEMAGVHISPAEAARMFPYEWPPD
jgi:C-terminal processing protease CtpA/Prc